MKVTALALALGAMLTVEQRDLHRSALDSPAAAVSDDGRYVAFATYARLAGADTDNAADLYVLDRDRQQVTFEGGELSDTTDRLHPDISADGRYLVYETDGSIVWRDRSQSVTRVVGKGRQPSIGAAGHIVVFTSGPDIQAVDTHTHETRRVSMDLPGLDSTAFAAVSPDVTADGRYVAFSARASHGHGDNRRSHVFVRDMQLNVTRRVGAGWAPSISGDGRYVSFVGPEDGLNHVFLADLHAGSTRLITKRPQGGRANGSSANPAVSSNGSVVVFQSQASDLAGGDDFNLLWDVFRYERSNGAIVRISGDPDEVWMEPSIGPSLDASGSVIAFSSRHPTGAADKRNDFDLYVAMSQGPGAHRR